MKDEYGDEGDTVAQARLRDEFLRDYWPDVYCDGPSPREAYIDHVSSHIGSGSIVLDIGAGTGHVLADLLRGLGHPFTAVGLDISLGMIEVAKKNLKLLRGGCLVRGDAARLPVADCSLDLVLSRLAPCSKADCFRALRPRGWFFLVVTGRDDWREVRDEFEQFEGRSEKDHASELRQVGFTGVVEEAFSYHEHYPFEAMVDVVEFVPIVEGFNRTNHLPVLRSLADSFETEKGVRVTRRVRILRATRTE